MSQTSPAFTEGSTFKHVLVMSTTTTVGLLALFIVDLLDIFYLSLLDDPTLVAGVGYASTTLFLLVSISIGLQIGMGALVARAEGAADREKAGRFCTSNFVYSTFLSTLACLVAWLFVEDILRFIGAEGESLEHALTYSKIIIPSSILLSVGMSAGAALRALGDAKRNMYTTLSGSIANAILDPIFIFGFDWGLEGAAWASVSARITIFCVGMNGVLLHHRLPIKPKLKNILEDIPLMNAVAFPAMLTNLSTPIANSIVLKVLASFGDEVIAGSAVLMRIIPVSFAGIFALSGAIGPIIGQNAGAANSARIKQTLNNSVLVVILYVAVVWLALALCQNLIISTFNIVGDGVTVIQFYCTYLAGFFIFSGLLFISNASFNNLGKAHYATISNYSRGFLGTIPIAYLLAEPYGLRGVLAAEFIASFIFGSIALLVAYGQANRFTKSAL